MYLLVSLKTTKMSETLILLPGHSVSKMHHCFIFPLVFLHAFTYSSIPPPPVSCTLTPFNLWALTSGDPRYALLADLPLGSPRLPRSAPDGAGAALSADVTGDAGVATAPAAPAGPAPMVRPGPNLTKPD